MLNTIALIILLFAPATEPVTIPHAAVGQVLGKTVYLDELEIAAKVDPNVNFDSSNKELWDAMGRMQKVFGLPLIERFKKNQKIEATEEELRQFVKSFRENRATQISDLKKEVAALEQQLKAKDLSAEQRTALEQKLMIWKETLESYLHPGKDDEASEREMGRQFIIAWKLQRDLHRKYGGRVIFQQFGPEALDGMRRLYEEAEKAGDLRIDDPGLRHLFYWYFDMEHTVIDDPKALEKPWFLDSVAPASQGTH